MENSQQALAQLQQAQASAKDPNAILQAQNQQFGVPAAQETVTGLRGAINNTTKLLKQVAPSVMGRTGNSLVTNAQANRIVQNEQAPLNESLGEQGRNYGMALEDADRLGSRASQAAQLEYGGQQDRLSYLQSLYDTLYGREQDATARADRLKAEEAARRSAAGSQVNWADLLRGDDTAQNAAPTIQDQAYASVQGFLQGSDDQIRSDYDATLKSANYGNAMDRLKVELYKQSRPDFFGGGGDVKTGNITVGVVKPKGTVSVR